MRAVIQQVLEAIGPKYLTRLRNKVTGQVPSDICLLFSSLFFNLWQNICQSTQGKIRRGGHNVL